MMGFLKPTAGNISILGKDAWKNPAELKKHIGYVPGEIAFPDTKSGNTFLKMQSELLHLKDATKINRLIQDLKLDTSADIKRMSKGMKQKTAIVDAFMSEPDILLLDEPTTGLDPVMRDIFIQLVLDAKEKGTTIVMSSHMFNELEPTCDKIAFIQNGKMIDIIDQSKIQTINTFQKVTIKLKKRTDFKKIIKTNVNILSRDDSKNTLTVQITDKEFNIFTDQIKQVEIENMTFDQRGLDDYFEEKLNLEVL
ncbi:aBC transporter ATP-binding protein [Enterococcus hermanniensis]|uniref:ABC transporter ATP-binding protein n=2 Tax=Enterococcus hermanniensis TaxID=249189 RepID=A0A1L8TPL1_9ENTE|nr:aBC transporter ATP-binding protein [Enterococcus hermanniensis]